MSRTKRVCLWAAALAAWAAPIGAAGLAGADVVWVGGARFEGRVEEGAEEVVLYAASGGRMTFPARSVTRIEYDVPAAPEEMPLEGDAPTADGDGQVLFSDLPAMTAPWGGPVTWGEAAFPIRSRGTALAVRNRILRLSAVYVEKRRAKTEDLVALVDALARVPRTPEFPALREAAAVRLQAAFGRDRKVPLWKDALPGSLAMADTETAPAGQAVLLVGMVGRWVARDGWDWGEFVDDNHNLGLILSRGQVRAGGVRGIRTAIGGLFVGRTQNGRPVILAVVMAQEDKTWGP